MSGDQVAGGAPSRTKAGDVCIGAWLFLLIILLLSACATARVSAVEAKGIDIEVKRSLDSKIGNVTVAVDEEKGETLIYGRVIKLGVYNHPFLWDRVCAVVFLPNGKSLAEQSAHLLPSPRAKSFRAIYPAASFRVRFPQVIPEGTTLLLRYPTRVPDNG